MGILNDMKKKFKEMMQGKDVLYFAYGSNMHQRRLEERVGQVEKVGKYILKDYALDLRAGHKSGVATVISCWGDSVEGVLYKLTAKQLKTLDLYEGVPICYVRSTIIDTNLTLDVVMYRARPYFRTNEPCDKDYLYHIIAGLLENDITIPGVVTRMENRIKYHEKRGERRIML